MVGTFILGNRPEPLVEGILSSNLLLKSLLVDWFLAFLFFGNHRWQVTQSSIEENIWRLVNPILCLGEILERRMGPFLL